MKKQLVCLAIAMASLLILARDSQSIDNQTVDVVMYIQTLDIEGLKVFDPVAAFPGESRVVKGRAVFKNIGYGAQDFTLRIASTSGSWTLFPGAGAIPADQYGLRAIFAVYNATLTVGSFGTDDILTPSGQAATSTRFFGIGTESDIGTPQDNGGYNVPQFGVGDNERHLFFRFDAGAAGSSGTSTSFINVTATPTP